VVAVSLLAEGFLISLGKRGSQVLIFPNPARTRVIASDAWRSRRLHEIAAHPAGARIDPFWQRFSFLSLDSGYQLLVIIGKQNLIIQDLTPLMQHP